MKVTLDYAMRWSWLTDDSSSVESQIISLGGAFAITFTSFIKSRAKSLSSEELQSHSSSLSFCFFRLINREPFERIERLDSLERIDRADVERFERVDRFDLFEEILLVLHLRCVARDCCRWLSMDELQSQSSACLFSLVKRELLERLVLLDRTDRFDEKLRPRCGAADGRVNCILQELVLLMIDVLRC